MISTSRFSFAQLKRFFSINKSYYQDVTEKNANRNFSQSDLYFYTKQNNAYQNNSQNQSVGVLHIEIIIKVKNSKNSNVREFNRNKRNKTYKTNEKNKIYDKNAKQKEYEKNFRNKTRYGNRENISQNKRQFKSKIYIKQKNEAMT